MIVDVLVPKLWAVAEILERTRHTLCEPPPLISKLHFVARAGRGSRSVKPLLDSKKHMMRWSTLPQPSRGSFP